MNTQASYFDTTSNRYTNVLNLPLAQTIEMEALGSIPGKNIMDFGAGMGRVTFYFLKKGYNVTAVDVSKQSLKDLKNLYKKHKTDTWGKLVTLSHIPNTQFDAIVGADILHHIDIPQYLPLFYKALKKGGRIAFSEPNAWHLLWYLHYFFSRIPWEVEKGILNCTKRNLLFQLKKTRFYGETIVAHGLFPTTPLSFFPAFCRFNAHTLGKIPLLNTIAFRLIVKAKK